MDIYNTRTASFGLLTLAFGMAGLCENHFADVKTFVLTHAFSKDDFSFLAAVIGAIVTLPVIGRIFEVPTVWIAGILRRRISSFPDLTDNGKYAAKVSGIDPSIDPSGAFHLIFYTKCPQELREWTHRRRNRMYSALSSSLAAVLGAFVSSVAQEQMVWVTWLAVIGFAAMQVASFYSELRLHDALVRAWWSDFRAHTTSE